MVHDFTPSLAKDYGTIGMRRGEIWTAVGKSVEPKDGAASGGFSFCQCRWKYCQSPLLWPVQLENSDLY